MTEQKGLYTKYKVFKVDTGAEVGDCFVLRPDRDPVARIALRAYAGATDNPDLATDLELWLAELEAPPDTTARCYNCGCYGRDMGDGEYECENCGNTWNIYTGPPDVP